MYQGTIQILFPLLRSAICGTRLTEDESSVYSLEVLRELLKISSKHDIDNLLAYGIKQNELVSDGNGALDNRMFKAIYRYETMNYEYGLVTDTLEREKIAFIPLKGAVIRGYYPEPWMRTSCDIDILVKRSELQRGIDVLTAAGYTLKSYNTHDVSLYSASGVHIELHFDLVEDGRANKCSEILNNVWSYVHLKSGCEYWYEMSDEMFWFYHIAHMAKHFEEGGCGIRPFLDMWILESRVAYDEKRRELLEGGELLRFSECCEKLSRVWFDGEEHDGVSHALEEYILRGGVYGTVENRVAAKQTKEGGRVKYFLSRIFLPYDTLKMVYPVLQKHKWLLPAMQVRRWFRVVFGGRAKVAMHELEANRSMSRESLDTTEKLFENIGL